MKVTAEEWDNHKDEIVSLYIIEDYSFRLVRQKQAKKGFNPSQSQYRTKLKSWKLRKPRRGSEIAIAASANTAAPAEVSSNSASGFVQVAVPRSDHQLDRTAVRDNTYNTNRTPHGDIPNELDHALEPLVPHWEPLGNFNQLSDMPSSAISSNGFSSTKVDEEFFQLSKAWFNEPSFEPLQRPFEPSYDMLDDSAAQKSQVPLEMAGSENSFYSGQRLSTFDQFEDTENNNSSPYCSQKAL